MNDKDENQALNERLDTFAKSVLENRDAVPDHLMEEQDYLRQALAEQGPVTLDQWIDAHRKRARPLHERLEDFQDRYIQKFIEATELNDMSLLEQMDDEKDELNDELEKQGGIDLVTWWEDRNNLRETEFFLEIDLRQPITEENLDKQLEAYGRRVARNDNKEPKYLSEKKTALNKALLQREGQLLGVWLNKYLSKIGPFERLRQIEKEQGAPARNDRDLKRIKSVLMAQYEKNDLNDERKIKIDQHAELLHVLNREEKNERNKETVKLEANLLAEVADTPRHDFDELIARINEDREADKVVASATKEKFDSLIEELKQTGQLEEFHRTRHLQDPEQDALLKSFGDHLHKREIDKTEIAEEKGTEVEIPNPEEILAKLQPKPRTKKSLLKAIGDTLRPKDEDKIAEYMNLPKGAFLIQSPAPEGNPCFGGTLVLLNLDQCYIRLDYPTPKENEPPLVMKLERKKNDGLNNAMLGDVFLITSGGMEQQWEFEKLQRPPKLVVPDGITKKLFEDYVIGRGNPPVTTVPEKFEIKKPSEIKLIEKGKGKFSAYSSQPEKCQALLTFGSDEVKNGIIIQFDQPFNVGQGQKFTGTITQKSERTDVRIDGLKISPNVENAEGRQSRNSGR